MQYSVYHELMTMPKIKCSQKKHDQNIIFFIVWILQLIEKFTILYNQNKRV